MPKSFKIYFLIIAGVFLTLNSFGFCWSQIRFLSDTERKNIAAKELLESFYYLEKQPWIYPDIKGKVVPYKTIQEFFDLNPNCCEIGRSHEYSEGILTATIFGCLSGTAPYVIGGKYQVRYLENNQIKSKTKLFAIRMSSCGHLSYNP